MDISIAQFVVYFDSMCVLLKNDPDRVPMISEKSEFLPLFFSSSLAAKKNQYVLAVACGWFHLRSSSTPLDLINTLILYDDAARIKERDWTAARCKSAFRRKETAKSNGPTVNLH